MKIIFPALMVLSFICPAKAELDLVRNGKPLADIVIAEAPPRAVKLAAMELQEYIFKISGATLPVVTAPGIDIPAHIYVGKSAYTDKLKITGEGLKFGAFRIASGKDYLALIGHDRDYVPPEFAPRNSKDIERWDKRTGEKWVNPVGSWMHTYSSTAGISDFDERGSLNAVYEFLRYLGVRWYMPGEIGEIVPKQKTIALTKVDKEIHPDFPYRDLGNYSPAFWYGTRDAILYKLRIGLAASPDCVGGDWPHGLINVHGRKETKEAHPEYYALYGGKRSLGVSGAGSPCLSSKGLFESTVKYARAVFDIYPDKPTVGIMPQDGYVDLCQCDLCKGKNTPARGRGGNMSDYVWGFVNRVAIEVYKTHPDRKIINASYGSYGLPPEKIAKFSPNVMVVLPMARDPVTRTNILELRKGYMEKVSPGNIISGGHYLHSRPGCGFDGLPVYFPHLIAEDLRSLKGVSQGEFIELSQGIGDGIGNMHAPAFNHLNVYVTARCYWDAGQDINALLNEYYEKFYGPAAKEMKAFTEYSEINWPFMRTQPEPVDKVLQLLDKARKAAGDTVYGKRIDLVRDYVRPMHELRNRLSVDRTAVPRQFTWTVSESRITLDGRLDEPEWGWKSYALSLSELETGRGVFCGTSFRVLWGEGAIYFGIRCADFDMKGLNISTTNKDDAALLKGDYIEVLLETQGHSFYQVALNPAGAIYDADMKDGTNTAWSSSARVAVHKGDNFWSAEMRLPVGDMIEGGVDPMKSVEGRRPSNLYPWFINVCRQRVRSRETERSAWAPTGDKSFNVPVKFGELYVR
ncbi:MAG: DUF4838 domain-containing protein [Kiritimatiellia bacterium]